jgi:L-lactate dehydrogenase (cytochrome)
MYWVGTRDRILQRVERARKAGAKALIVTLDWSFATRRDWGSPAIPEKLDLKAMARFAPEAVLRPRYLADWLRSGKLPNLTCPNLAGPGEELPTFFGAYGEWMFTPLPTWEDVRWLREEWGGPFAVKGIMHPDDARRAVDIGATAISVSNHGGNNLDSTPATIRLLPAVADAVRGQIEILLDGGIRRGSDVVSAGAGRQGRHDRPRLPVGPGRGRREGRHQRPADPALRHRGIPARSRARLGPRRRRRRPARPVGLHALVQVARP